MKLFLCIIACFCILSLIDESIEQKKQIEKQQCKIDTLSTICSVLIKQDSTILHLLTCRDTSKDSRDSSLYNRDTCGIWAY